MEALPRTYKGPKGFVQVSPLGMVSSVVHTDLPEFVRNQPELYRPHMMMMMRVLPDSSLAAASHDGQLKHPQGASQLPPAQ